MAFDFTYDNTQIQSTGGFKPNKKNAPVDVRTIVDTYADIVSIPNPYVGLTVTVKTDETNDGKMTDYKVLSLKANALGVANTVVNEVKRMNEYLDIPVSSGSGLSSEQTQQLTTAYNHSRSAHVQSNDIPTKLSELNNDLQFATTTDISNEINKLSFSLEKSLLSLMYNGSAVSTINLPTSTGGGNVIINGNIVPSTTSLSVNEEETITLNVKLDKAPTQTQVVNVSLDNSYCSIDKTTLTFNSTNYNIDQVVTITGAAVAASTYSTITLSSDNVANVLVSIAIINSNTNNSGGVATTKEPVTDGLVCWLESRDVEYGSSTWSDKTENGHDCTPVNGTFSTEEGKVKLFDNDQLKIATTNFPTGTKTYEFHYEQINVKYYNSFFYCGESVCFKAHSATQYGIWKGVGSTSLAQGNASGLERGVITLVISDSGSKLYKDGSFVESKSFDTSSFIDFANELYINKEQAGNNRDMYSKYIISFKVYDRELSAEEIETNYEYEQWLLTKLDSEIPTITENYDVFVVAGQSNAVGYGTPKLDTDTFDSSIVYQYKQDNTIEALSSYPLDHIEKLNDTIAFQHTFLNKYIEDGHLKEGRKILLVPCAAPGTSFISGRWQESGDLQKALIRRIKEVKSMNDGNYNVTFKAVLWHQGESDVIENNTPSNYKTQLKGLINNVRNAIGDVVPFIMGEWQKDWHNTMVSKANPILAVISEITTELPNCYLTSSADLSGDAVNGNIHFSAEAQRTFGERYYDGYQSILASYSNTLAVADLSIENISGSIWSDTSGANNNATLNITGTGGVSDGALVFDGDDYCYLEPKCFNFGSGDFTVQVVGKYNSTPTGSNVEVMISQADGAASNNSKSISLYASSEGIVFNVFSDTHTMLLDHVEPMTTNESSFAIVRNGGKLFAYIDDECVASEYISDTSINVNNTNKIALGRFGEKASLYLNGYIKGVHIEKRALTKEELIANKTRFTS